MEVWHITFHAHYVFEACSEVVLRFERKTFYIGSVRVTIILAWQKGVEMSLTLNEPK